MKEPEHFLTRWSRRKRDLGEHDEALPPEQPATEPMRGSAPLSDPAEPEGGEDACSDVPPFDTASLPPLESITAESDIRGYFARGVPAALARAALRRVWASDPAIRDFVGLSENAWDFNAPETIPGFGRITAADDVAGMMRQMMGDPGEALRPRAPESGIATPQAVQTPEHRPMRRDTATNANPDAGGSAPARHSPERGDPQQQTAEPHEGSAAHLPNQQAAHVADERRTTVRSHGGALPE